MQWGHKYTQDLILKKIVSMKLCYLLTVHLYNQISRKYTATKHCRSQSLPNKSFIFSLT